MSQPADVQLLGSGPSSFLCRVQGLALARQGETTVDHDPGEQPQCEEDADHEGCDLPAVVLSCPHTDSKDSRASLAVHEDGGRAVAFHGLSTGQVRSLRLVDVDVGWLRIDDRKFPLASAVRERRAACLDYRTATWSNTADPYLFGSRSRDMETPSVGICWCTLLLGPDVGCRSIREDRILAEAMASREDAEGLHGMFGLSINTAHRYANVVEHRGFTGFNSSAGRSAIADNDVMTRWFRSHWAEGDTWFYFEADADGWVTRQVELEGPPEMPIAAASLAEWEAAQRAGTLRDYEATFGSTAEIPVQEWDAHEPQDLAAEEFETVWLTARATCRERARARSTSGA